MSDGMLDLWGTPDPLPAPVPASTPKEPDRFLPTLTVGQLTRQIRGLLERELGEVSVRGEISNFHAPGSGHLYFTLKDKEGLLHAVMFRADAAHLSTPLRDGQAVRLYGRITVYETRGQYQIQVYMVHPEGVGDLQERFERLKQKLMSEGLFETDRKRALPVFPQRVGLITALQGAVIHDFCHILQRRAPGIEIHVRGVHVQGDDAPREIAAAIAAFNEETSRPVDLIVVARGGGSLEDLWAFNEEKVARALAASRIPTISAIGHETDFTIADFVADLRAPTPSAAAELLSRDWAEWRAVIDQLGNRLTRTVRHRIAWERERCRRLEASPLFREPRRYLAQQNQRVDDLAETLGQGLRRAVGDRRRDWEMVRARWEHAHPAGVVEQLRDRLGQWEARLRALGPEATLARGYALVLNRAGRPIRKAAETKRDEKIAIRFADGMVDARVETLQVEPGDERKPPL